MNSMSTMQRQRDERAENVSQSMVERERDHGIGAGEDVGRVCVCVCDRGGYELRKSFQSLRTIIE